MERVGLSRRNTNKAVSPTSLGGVLTQRQQSLRWICQYQIPTPQTKDGCAPSLTATYEYASFANMFDTGYYPRMGVIEIGKYEK